MLDLNFRPDSAPSTEKARPSRLTCSHAIDEAIALILENCLEQVRANRAAAEDGRDPEGVHQMRVGLRRLRAALQFLGKAIPAGSFARFEAEAEALTDALGPVRNLDALDGRLAKLRTIDRQDRRALRQAIKARRKARYRSFRDALHDQRGRAF